MSRKKRDNDIFLIKLSKRIRSLRENKRMTLYDAEAKGWPCWQQLQRLETGGQDVKILTLKKIADFYDIKLSDLLSGLD